MRKIVSFSCLLLCASFWTTAVRAQQNPPVSAPAVTGVELPAPADTVVKDQPLATSPPVSFKVDLTGASIPAPNSDQEAVARALKQYDDSMRQWTLPPETMNGIVADSSKFGAPQQNFRLHRNDDYYPRTAREMEWNRQRFEDRIADVRQRCDFSTRLHLHASLRWQRWPGHLLAVSLLTASTGKV